MRPVGRVKQDHVVRTLARNRREEGLTQIAVWIEERNAATRANIRPNQVMEKRGLAHAGFADDGDVPPAVLGENAETLVTTAEVRCAEDRELRITLARR